MNKPKISIICPSRNHEKYIEFFMRSVLAQEEKDFELIIVDDFSTDNNVKEIEKFNDPRIHLVKQNYHKGFSAAIVTALAFCNADIVSLIASDDMFHVSYLSTVLKEFEKNIDVAYVALDHIDDNNNLLNRKTFLPVELSQDEIFAKLFVDVNIVPSPGMAFRKSAILPFMPLDLGLIQYTDWQMHIFLFLKNKISLINIPLIYYRINCNSASYRCKDVVIRENIEMNKLMDTGIKLIGNDVALFKRFFGKYEVVKDKNILPQTIPFWLAMLVMTSGVLEKRKWGLQTIMNFISTQNNMDLLYNTYGFTFTNYLKFAGELIGKSEYEIEIERLNKKIKRYKKTRKILIGVIVCCVITAILFFAHRQ